VDGARLGKTRMRVLIHSLRRRPGGYVAKGDEVSAKIKGMIDAFLIVIDGVDGDAEQIAARGD